MLLAIDVGNSQTVLGVFEGARLAHHWRLSTLIDRTADEFALEIAGLLGLAGLAFPGDIDGIAICSVVPEVTQRLRDMSVRYSGTEALVVRPGIKLGMPIRMDDPREVGADRLVNAVAAYASVGGPAIVVDFGTATSFDVVSARGEFIGGAIAPGVSTSMTALAARGAQLRTVEIAAPRQAIGRNTVEAHAVRRRVRVRRPGRPDRGGARRGARNVGPRDLHGGCGRRGRRPLPTGRAARAVAHPRGAFAGLDPQPVSGPHDVRGSAPTLRAAMTEQTEQTEQGSAEPDERSRLQQLMAERRAAAASLRERGVEPWPADVEVTTTITALREAFADRLEPGEDSGEVVAVAGRLVARRGHGKLSFLELREEGASLQLLCQLDVLGDAGMQAVADVDVGDWVHATGPVVRSRRGELSVQAHGVRLIGKALRPMPRPVARAARRRDALPSARGRPARERRGATGLPRSALRSSTRCAPSSSSVDTSRSRHRCCTPSPAARSRSPS